MSSTVDWPAYWRSSTKSSTGLSAASPVTSAVTASKARRRSISKLPRQVGGGPSSAAAAGSSAAAAGACAPSISRSLAAGVRPTTGMIASTSGCRNSDCSVS